MRPGLIGGFLAGTALSVAVLGVVSELVPGVTLTPPQATAPAVPAGSAFREPREDRAATLPAADTTPAPEPAPRVPLPERDDTAPLESADTTPAEGHDAPIDARLDLTFEGEPAYCLTGPWVPYLAVVVGTVLAELCGVGPVTSTIHIQ